MSFGDTQAIYNVTSTTPVPAKNRDSNTGRRTTPFEELQRRPTQKPKGVMSFKNSFVDVAINSKLFLPYISIPIPSNKHRCLVIHLLLRYHRKPNIS